MGELDLETPRSAETTSARRASRLYEVLCSYNTCTANTHVKSFIISWSSLATGWLQLVSVSHCTFNACLPSSSISVYHHGGDDDAGRDGDARYLPADSFAHKPDHYCCASCGLPSYRLSASASFFSLDSSWKTHFSCLFSSQFAPTAPAITPPITPKNPPPISCPTKAPLAPPSSVAPSPRSPS